MYEGFNIDEIFEIATQMERNGASFYRKAAAAMEDASARELLLELAEMEEQHEEVFQEIRSELTRAIQNEDFDPDGEAAAYLRAFLGDAVFPDERKIGRKVSMPNRLEDILLTAIQLEKESILFYQGIREVMPENLGKDKVQVIIVEEMKHVVRLTKRLETKDHPLT